MRTGAQDAIEDQEGAEDSVCTAKAQALFNLDARSQPALLDGLTLGQVQQRYVEGTEGRPINTENNPFQAFLLADEKVLAKSDLAKSRSWQRITKRLTVHNATLGGSRCQHETFCICGSS